MSKELISCQLLSKELPQLKENQKVATKDDEYLLWLIINSYDNQNIINMLPHAFDISYESKTQSMEPRW